jgi:hypothetical protein
MVKVFQSEFQAALSSWRGRPYILRELEYRGFGIHRHYDQVVAAGCPSGMGGDLQLYWNEMAREYICSRGRAKSWARLFPEMECYRSKYLDDLALRQSNEPPFRRAMHPCILAFETKRPSGHLSGVNKNLEILKVREIESHKVYADFWDGTAQSIPVIFHNLMTKKGFKKQGKKNYIKRVDNGLLFGGHVDLGGKPYCISVPFRFFIAHRVTEVKEDVFELWLHRVEEGINSYRIFASNEAAVLGFRAYVEMFDILSQSFSTGAE